jgi:hypothetical protein
MYGGFFVDTNRLLGDGGYITSKPYLYPLSYTKESIIQDHKDLSTVLRITDSQMENLLNNLKDCKMVTVELKIVGEDE